MFDFTSNSEKDDLNNKEDTVLVDATKDIPFGELTVQLKDTLISADNKGYDLGYIPKEQDPIVINTEKKENNIINMVIDNNNQIVNILDENVEIGDINDEEVNEKVNEDKSNENENSKNVDVQSPIIVNGKVQWIIKSPSRLYDPFYKVKIEFIQHLSNREQLNFDKLSQEISECSVDMNDESYNSKNYQKKMATVHQYRERLRKVQLECNVQYFLWKRFIELLRGCLSRVQYERPVIKQDGLYHEHLRDVEYYFCRLEALYIGLEEAMRTLDGAFFCLKSAIQISSRPECDGDRLSPRSPAGYQEDEKINTSHSKELEDFDSLGEKQESNRLQKYGTIDWGAIK